ncbi:MAG TPA: DmsE family decaheme c-type cytochrome [Terracidiphilus sp.]|jgi:DmsE family decaheme c-type cytochrome
MDEAADCARCHKAAVLDSAVDSHSKLGEAHGHCMNCHGSGKAHAQSGDVAQIFSFSAASASEVDQRCRTCHDGDHAGADRSTHVKANVSCTGCHRIHAAEAAPHFLKAAQPELCYQCHNDIKKQFSLPFHHKVAEGLIQCTDCHNVHGAEEEKVRRSTSWQFEECTKCHASVAGPFLHPHPAVKEEGCTACHFPHGGANAKLLTQANVNTICLQCHSPSLSSTTVQPSAPSHARSAPGQSCTSCHANIHGSTTSEIFLNVLPENRIR